MTTDPTRAQADEAPRQHANREAERLAQQLEQAAALLRHLGAMHGGLAADAQPLEAKRYYDENGNRRGPRLSELRESTPPAQSEGSRASIEEQHDRIMGPRGRFR